MRELVIPEPLAAGIEAEGRDDWLDALPRRVDDLARRWDLVVDEPFHPGGWTAWVAPASRGGESLVLKVGFAHFEARDEAEGLRLWDGDPTVRLVASEQDGDTVVLLLERCQPGTPLNTLPEPDQDEVLAGLLRRLWREPPTGHDLRELTTMCDAWADSFDRDLADDRVTLDAGLARTGIDLFRSLPRSADRRVVLGTDLHAGNVLAAEREPWLVIDPKPYVGDPTYDVLQHCLNCERLHTDPIALVRRMAALCDLDPERLRLWLFARCVQQSPDWPAITEVARQLAPA
jgi:streptomycin 6-kinase